MDSTEKGGKQDKAARETAAREGADEKGPAPSIVPPGASPELFRTLVDKVKDGIFVIDPETSRIVDINEGACLLFGFSREELLSLSVSDVKSASSQQLTWQEFLQTVKNNQGSTFEDEFYRKDESTFQAEISAQIVSHEGGEYLVSVVRDVTDRKKYEVRESLESAFRRAIEGSMHAGVATVDLKGRQTSVNEGFCRMVGWSEEELVGSYPPFVYWAPDESAALMACVKDNLSGKTPPDAREMRFCRKSGEIFEVQAVYAPIFDDQGEITGCLAVVFDISEQTRSEKMLANILESVGEGFIVVDRNLTILSANRAYCRMAGEEEKSIVGRPCYEVSHRSERPCYEASEICPVKDTFKTGNPKIAIHVHQDSNNEPVWVEVRSFPITNASGQVVSVIEVLNDISEKRKLEEQLLRAQRMEAVGRLSGGIAHDFNNILTAIFGSCSLLELSLPEESPARENVKAIVDASDRAADLIRNLLAFSRRQVMDPVPLELNTVLRSVEKLLRTLVGEDILLEVKPSDSSLMLLADVSQVEQVLMNLAVNAKDAMAGGGKITISLEKRKIDKNFVQEKGFGRPGEFAVLSFADQGEGMNERTQAKIFEPFFTTKEQDKGTGLGLATVYGIVKQHEGYIDVASVEGEGTVFSLYLPLTDVIPGAKGVEESPLALSGTETILLVEDQTSVRSVVRQTLAGRGYRIVEAVDGQEAMEIFTSSAEEFDLLLTDVVLPRKTGIDMAEEATKLAPTMKVIFMSGYSADYLGEDPGVIKAVHFLSKPFTSEQLLTLVRKVLDVPL